VTELKKHLDVTGMTCPSPLIQLRTTIDSIDSGEVLEIRGDDPVFEVTVRDYCEQNEHKLLSVQSEGRVVTIQLEK